MTAQHAKSIVKQLAGMYRGITQADAQFLCRQLKEFPQALAVAVMDDYRKSHAPADGFDAAAFITACEQAAKPTAPARFGGTSFVDVYRNQNKSLRDAGDVEVVLRVHFGWWQRCDQSDTWRAKIDRGCRSELMAVKVKASELDELAAIAFLPPEDFKASIVALRESRTPAAAFG